MDRSTLSRRLNLSQSLAERLHVIVQRPKSALDKEFAYPGRCDRNFSKVATARGFARGLLALAKCSARCDQNP